MELFDCLWILNVLWIQGCVYAVQQFEIKPSDVEVNPGDMAILTCKVHNRKGECAWLKDGKVMGRIDEKYVFLREPEDGDCSIRIYRSTIEGDDGMWQCQVTQTSLSEPTLTSPDVKLTVREPPMPPRIEDNTNVLASGEPYPTQAGKPKRLHCISRKGNPPALLKWFIEDQDITTMSNQTNSTDVERQKTWQAVSVLDYVFQKDHNGKFLRCVAIHAAYENFAMEIRVKLEVLYVPEIRLEGRPIRDIEEGESLSVKCVADANPAASVIWKKSGYSSIYALKDQIDFHPIKKSDKGIYSCSASNDVGTSQELHVNIDVKYKPQIIKTSPDPGKVNINNSTALLCEAEGNPPPKYSWLQRMGGDPVVFLQRGSEAELHIVNVTYQYQGQYICEATNVINGQQYKAKSHEIHLDVMGAPQVLTDTARTKRRVVVEKDEDAVIAVYFCSDPRPIRFYWEFGSNKLESGDNNVPRYIVEDLQNDDGAKDCYEARLVIKRVDGTDSRKYTLHVQNERGMEVFAVSLEVREPVAVSVVIGIVVGCIVLLMIITLIVLYLLKAERMCFNRKSFKTDTSSSDGSRRSAELLHNGHQNKHGAIPPDALYTASSKREVSTIDRPLYENLKPDHNENQDALVYASLDLANAEPLSRNNMRHPVSELNGQQRQQPPVRRDRTEYAEIQFKPREQADI